MIYDPAVIVDVRKQWAALRSMGRTTSRIVPGGPVVMQSPAAEFFNLPLVLAYGVLHQVLLELIEQGSVPRPFDAKGNVVRNPALSACMKAARLALTWIDFNVVDDGRQRRKDLAHEAKLLTKADCLRYIEAIEAELTAWGVV